MKVYAWAKGKETKLKRLGCPSVGHRMKISGTGQGFT